MDAKILMDTIARGATPVITIALLAYVSSTWWPVLPNIQLLLVVLFGVCITTLLKASRSIALTRIFALATIIGVFCAASVGHWYDTWQLSDDKFQQDVIIQGQVTSIAGNQHRQRLQIDVNQIDGKTYWLARKVRLTLYRSSQVITEGSRVQLSVKLKRPRGLANPIGFDYARWLLTNNIVATGYVRQVYLIDSLPLPSFRSQMITQISALPLQQKRFVLALAVGDRTLLTAADWQMLQISGLAHLFAISGLHLSVVSVLVLALLGRFVHFCLATLRIVSRQNKIQQVSLKPLLYVSCVGFCAGYAYLAGWQLPVVRAYFSIVLVLSLIILRFRNTGRHLLLAIFVLCLFSAPYSIYGMSLWMSFSAVFIIVVYHWRFASYGESAWYKKLTRLCHFQIVITLSMLPLVVGYFDTISLVSIPANLLFVPVVTLIIVPLCLCAVAALILLPAVSQILFAIVDWLLSNTLILIDTLISFPFAALTSLHLQSAELLAISMLIVVWLVPRTILYKPLLIAFCIPLLISVQTRWMDSNDRQWTVHVFDVGQGTAIAIIAQDRAIVIDTGPAFDGGLSSAQQIILPFLKARGITQLDHLFVSHYDNDHAGGLDILRNYLDIARFTGPELCRRGDSLNWQHLQIEVLWPTFDWLERPGLSDNDSSCVLRVSDQHNSILFSGDIERAAETALVTTARQQSASLDADVLIAPHHGSNTSSTWGFINAVKAQYVVFTTGFANRFNFPHPEVVERYRHWQTNMWNTADHGYLRITVEADQPDGITIVSWRHDLNRRWFD